VPIIGDFHYNGHVLLTKYPDCAAALDNIASIRGMLALGNGVMSSFPPSANRER